MFPTSFIAWLFDHLSEVAPLDGWSTQLSFDSWRIRSDQMLGALLWLNMHKNKLPKVGCFFQNWWCTFHIYFTQHDSCRNSLQNLNTLQPGVYNTIYGIIGDKPTRYTHMVEICSPRLEWRQILQGSCRALFPSSGIPVVMLVRISSWWWCPPEENKWSKQPLHFTKKRCLSLTPANSAENAVSKGRRNWKK